MKILMNLTSKNILEKKFSINLKGYDIYEVDYYLDIISKDYESWKIMNEQKEEELEILKKELEILKTKNNSFKNYIKKYKKDIKILEEKSTGNVDLIRRINKLEETS